MTIDAGHTDVKCANVEAVASGQGVEVGVAPRTLVDRLGFVGLNDKGTGIVIFFAIRKISSTASSSPVKKTQTGLY